MRLAQVARMIAHAEVRVPAASTGQSVCNAYGIGPPDSRLTADLSRDLLALARALRHPPITRTRR